MRAPPQLAAINYQHQHQLNMHVHAGTGGHYTTAVNLNEECSGTSSFSSSSKRQRLEDQAFRYHSHMLQMMNGMPLLAHQQQMQEKFLQMH